MLEGNWTSTQGIARAGDGKKTGKRKDLQGEGTHQSLISCALESRPTFFLQVLSPETPEPFTPSSVHRCEERKLVFSFMVHVYFWCVAGIVMFLMAGPGDLSRMMVHLQETVLMMHWPWLQAPSVLNEHTRHKTQCYTCIHTAQSRYLLVTVLVLVNPEHTVHNE